MAVIDVTTRFNEDAFSGRFIRKYYLSDWLRQKALAPDIEALAYDSRLAKFVKGSSLMRPPEVLISYSDILAEKSLSSEEVRVILDAANVYISERGAPLKQETVDTALGLNRKLIQLEIEVVEKCRKLDEEIRQKILEGMDISDYEIEAFFGFYLKEDDPYSYDGAAFWNCIYNQDDCAIVAEVTDNGKMALSENHYGIGSSLDFCDMHGSARLAPLCSERHCWLFRQLHDRCQIPFSHMQRIGEVWTDIRLVYQKQWALV